MKKQSKISLALLFILLASLACSLSPAPPRCVPATSQQLERIRAGVKGIEATNDVLAGWAVKSNDYENVWFVAAKIYGIGIENGTKPGVWALNGDPESIAGAMSINALALTFSNWADGPASTAHTTMDDDGAQEAYDCANQ